MGYSSRHYSRGYSFRNFFPNGVRWLLIANVAVFIVYFFSALPAARYDRYITSYFALFPIDVAHGYVWQLATYLFLHSIFSFSHILFNMLALWMFGADLERAWGTRRFLKFYFFCGIGAGICVVVGNYLFGGYEGILRPTIGASGAIYGLLLAFGMMFPDTIVLFSFLFPIKAKYFVMIIGAIAFLSSFGANNGVSNIAHLGGMLFGFIYLKSQSTKKFDLFGSMRREYQQWKLQRARKKFQVYMRKHNGRDPWVN